MAMVRRISGARPEELPWEEIRGLANRALPILKDCADGVREKPTRNLILTAAIIATCIAEFGPGRFDEVLDLVKSQAKKNPAGFFRVCFAQRLEFANICPEDRGAWTLSMFQDSLGRAIAWFERHREAST